MHMSQCKRWYRCLTERHACQHALKATKKAANCCLTKTSYCGITYVDSVGQTSFEHCAATTSMLKILSPALQIAEDSRRCTCIVLRRKKTCCPAAGSVPTELRTGAARSLSRVQEELAKGHRVVQVAAQPREPDHGA